MRKAIAIDFDGCLCGEMWPGIGQPNLDVINAAILEKQKGAALILWTCRTGKLLEEAVEFCRSYGLEFDSVNENLPERVELYGVDCRKVGADEYWDDRAVHMPAFSVPDNTPLTLEEVYQRDGKPIWVCGLPGRKIKWTPGWRILEGNRVPMRSSNDIVLSHWTADYGRTWIAYDREPKEGAK